jgi:hypothetical protein
MARPLSELRELVHQAFKADPAREERRAERESSAERIAPLLPLVHRTGKGAPLRAILDEGRLRPPDQPNDNEKALALPASVYFFYGAGCYPKGSAALVVAHGELDEHAASEFTPFDTGCLAKPYVSHPREGWADDLAGRRGFREEHAGRGADLGSFAPSYLAAHFRAPLEYVRRSTGDPDFAAYHGLSSPTKDRRAWTIEARVGADVALDPAGALQAILVDGTDLCSRIPDAYARLIAPVEHPSGNFAQAIAAELERRLEPAS